MSDIPAWRGFSEQRKKMMAKHLQREARRMIKAYHQQNEALLLQRALCPWFCQIRRYKCTPSQQSSTLQQRIQLLTRTLAILSLPGRNLFKSKRVQKGENEKNKKQQGVDMRIKSDQYK